MLRSSPLRPVGAAFLLAASLTLALAVLAAGAHSAPRRAAETVVVSNTNADPVQSQTLQPDHRYRITATGTISDWCPDTAAAASDCSNGSPLAIGAGVDALYCYATWRCPQNELWRQLQVNGQGLDELAGQPGKIPYSPSHTYSVTVTSLSGPLQLVTGDGSREDNSGAFHVTIADLGVSAEPVPIESVSNGCGGAGWDSLVRAQNYLGNTSVYKDSNKNPLATSYSVSFADACNLHDAGYSGAVVRDKIRGGIKDFRRWTRRQIDEKFLADMRALCERQIPATAAIALSNCKSTGGNLSVGAESRYNFVRRFGYLFFDADPSRPGVQRTGPRANN